MSRRLLLPLAALLALSLAAPVLAAPFPSEIPLPGGYRPEGITAGTGSTAYVGSLADGAIVRVNVRTGSVDPFAAGATGRVTAGLDYEDGAHRLWAAPSLIPPGSDRQCRCCGIPFRAGNRADGCAIYVQHLRGCFSG